MSNNLAEHLQEAPPALLRIETRAARTTAASTYLSASIPERANAVLGRLTTLSSHLQIALLPWTALFCMHLGFKCMSNQDGRIPAIATW